MEKLIAGAEKLGLHLAPEQLEQFRVYYRELTDWNSRVNLTRITGDEEVQVKHFLDSLTLALVVPPPTGEFRVIDVGSGAGLPGVPLKILWPGLRLALLEATAKKAEFLEHLGGRLGLEDVEVITGRAEDVARHPGYREGYDLALSRAVAPLPTLVELTLPFCAVGGRFIAQKKGEIDRELRQAATAIAELGGKLGEIKRVPLTEFKDRRCLVVIEKVAPTPGKYPRRPGMPEKRPIQ